MINPAHASTSVRGGYVALSVSVLFNGAAVHLQKAAMGDRDCPPSMLVALNGCGALLIFLALGILWRSAGWKWFDLQEVTAGAILRWLRGNPAPLLIATLGAGLGGVLQQSCNHTYGAEITSFLSNQTMAFLVLGGVLMGERIRLFEGLTILGVLGGALLFSYRGGELQWVAWGLMALSCIGMAGKQLAVKRASGKTALPIVMAGVMLGAALWAAVTVTVRQEWKPITPRAWGFILASSLANNVIGMMLLYVGFLRVGVARGAPVDCLRPLAVLLIGLICLGAVVPGPWQLVGGALILAGSVLLTQLHRPQPPALADSADVENKALAAPE